MSNTSEITLAHPDKEVKKDMTLIGASLVSLVEKFPVGHVFLLKTLLAITNKVHNYEDIKSYNGAINVIVQAAQNIQEIIISRDSLVKELEFKRTGAETIKRVIEMGSLVKIREFNNLILEQEHSKRVHTKSRRLLLKSILETEELTRSIEGRLINVRAGSNNTAKLRAEKVKDIEDCSSALLEAQGRLAILRKRDADHYTSIGEIDAKISEYRGQLLLVQQEVERSNAVYKDTLRECEELEKRISQINLFSV